MSFRSTLTIAVVSFLVLLTGCASVTLDLGKVTIGGSTFATEKSRAICGYDNVTQSDGRQRYSSKTDLCQESYRLGNKACTRDWQQTQIVYGSGKPSFQYNSETTCIEKQDDCILTWKFSWSEQRQGKYSSQHDSLRLTNKVCPAKP